ncbi:MAG TPA: porin [Oligoflexia bacterium]|nr:porin [Oligoflexia bacterium]HMP47100.1 porin [Oligoflexia bacterium]
MFLARKNRRYLGVGLVASTLIANITGMGSVEATPRERGLLSSAIISESVYEKTGLDFRGWVNGGVTWNTWTGEEGFNGPVGFNDRSDRLQMNQLYGIIERKVTEDAFSLGGRADILYGTDARYARSLGFDDRWVSDGTSRFYKLAVPQAFLELNTPVGNGLKFKAGHFYSPLGYESVMAPENFFYSHSYARTYAQPFTFWGATAAYNLTDKVELAAGAVRGWDNMEHKSDRNLGFLSTLTVRPSDDTLVKLGLITGNEGRSTNQTLVNLVVSHAFTDYFTYAVEGNYGRRESERDLGLEKGQWAGLASYALFRINEIIGLGTRVEWYREDEGAFRVVGINSGAGGVKGNYYSASVGANVDLFGFVTLRPEIRWDYQDRDSSSDPKAFRAGKDVYQFLASADAIVQF